MSITIWV